MPPAIFAFTDYVVTTRGQPLAYLAGDFDAALERNPLAEWFMKLHPDAFLGLAVLWLAVIILIVLKSPRLVARMASIAIAFSHAFCTGTWLYDFPHGYFYALAICISSAILSVLALEWSQEENIPVSPVSKA